MLNTRRSLAKDFIVWGRWKWNSPLPSLSKDKHATRRWRQGVGRTGGRVQKTPTLDGKGARAKKMDGFLKSNSRLSYLQLNPGLISGYWIQANSLYSTASSNTSNGLDRSGLKRRKYATYKYWKDVAGVILVFIAINVNICLSQLNSIATQSQVHGMSFVRAMDTADPQIRGCILQLTRVQ
ncbi:hypothetical protein CEXT_667651 [Caerostris extrusa]|uniref:Uncharacterized protein n=1 Tax=Caerostris extrusa TaxID=172846 RepID=A0AAV4VC12_CAEEX|nr:hypothetical protein CEXT_667651 [Caerostris extrusa]